MGDIPQGIQLFVPEEARHSVQHALEEEAKRLAALGMYHQAAALSDLSGALL